MMCGRVEAEHAAADAPMLPNIHPGEVLREEFLKPFGLSQNRLAREIGGPRAVSTRSFWRSEPSPPIPPSVLPVSSEPVRASGWAYRRTMISSEHDKRSASA
jgi:hypothetical protein